MQAQFKPHTTTATEHELNNHFSEFLTQLLVNRNITTKQEADQFIHPQWKNHHDPFLMKNAEKAAQRIKKALDNEERITIYADYDADGIPGATVLASLFDKLKYTNYDIYLPHRHDEGYGIHIEALKQIQESDTDLVVTIDVGITAHEAAEWSQEQGLDMIITDHHEPICNVDGSQHLPHPFLLINPKQQGCTYPDDMLCGCGVMFKVIQAFLALYREEYAIHEGWEKWLLDMVGLATISDMVPLSGENRMFSYFGMQVISKTKRPGLRKLIWDAGLDINNLTEEDLAFSVTPKLNAASRMSHPEDALKALRAKTSDEARIYSQHLRQLNDERKKLVAKTMKEALSKLRSRDLSSVIVIGSPHWQAGILGLVASKLVEHFHLPAFVWGQEQGIIKGSCRSVEGIDLVELMSKTQEATFIQYGGHAGAGGFSCNKRDIHSLEQELNDALVTYRKDNGEVKEYPVMIDAELKLNDVTIHTYQELRKLAPFGQGNPKPLFMFKNITPYKIELFGKAKNHLKLWFKNDKGVLISAIKFFANAQSMQKEVKEQEPLNLIAHIDYSVFRGKHELRLSIIDIVD